jgi:hypothetical protein
MTGRVREPQFPPGRVAGRERGWYRGDCHVHSVRSHGGELTPGQLAAGARAGGLDFIATTEHNTTDMHGAWGRLAGDDLLVILGQEVTTQTANRCPVTGRAPSSGAPAARNQHSSGSRYATPEGIWRRSPILSS